MGIKDTITKKYMQNDQIFADAFNFLIYDGEQVIKPENLRELDTTSISLPYGDDDVVIPVQKQRDVMKMAVAKKDDNCTYLVLGIENQSDIHYAMPVRNGLYDMIHYANQVANISKAHRTAGNNGTREEFLSGLHHTDKIIPVITLVVYFGTEKWDVPKTLHEMMSIKDKRVLAFSPDYKINLIAPEQISDTEFTKFHSELSLALKYIKYSQDKEKLKAVVNNKEFQDINSIMYPIRCTK